MALRMETTGMTRRYGAAVNKERNKGRSEAKDVAEPAGVGLNAPLRYHPAVKVDNHEIATKRIAALKSLLKTDPKAADFKWSLFVAASNTYRFDSCLRPFPPMYIKNECKDIDALRRAIESIPPFAIVFDELGKPDVYENYGTSIELLYWVLIKLREPHVKSVEKMHYEKVMRLAPLEQSAASGMAAPPPPNFIFQLTSSKQSTTEREWKIAVEGHSTFYAYHGSRLENFHSIIHYGLQANTRNKASDKGVCMSSELTASLPSSPVGYGWGGSILGGGLSCVALCELLDCPDVKKQGTKIRPPGESISEDKQCFLANSELARTRYLLIYSQEDRIARNDGSSGLFGWFKQHRLLTFVLGYVVLLASVGLMRDRKFGKFYRLFLNKTSRE